MKNKNVEEIAIEESCNCNEDVFEYNGTTYTIKVDNEYCEELKEDVCASTKTKKIVAVGAGIAAASGVLFFTLHKKKNKK